MVADNRAGRRAAAKAAGVPGQLVSQLVVIDDDGSDPAVNRSELIAAAVVNGLGALIEKGAAPLERAVITIGTDHPEHPGKVVLELKTDRMAPRLLEKMGKPITLGELRGMGDAVADLAKTDKAAGGERNYGHS